MLASHDLWQLAPLTDTCMHTGAYSVGVPQRFVTNFTASQRFLESLETLCSSTRAVEVFRGSAAYQSWQDRWKLSVYYGLCFQVSVAASLDFSPMVYAKCDMHVSIMFSASGREHLRGGTLLGCLQMPGLSQRCRMIVSFADVQSWASFLDACASMLQTVASTVEDSLSSAEVSSAAADKSNTLHLSLQPTLILYRSLQRCALWHQQASCSY